MILKFPASYCHLAKVFFDRKTKQNKNKQTNTKQNKLKNKKFRIRPYVYIIFEVRFKLDLE